MHPVICWRSCRIEVWSAQATDCLLLRRGAIEVRFVASLIVKWFPPLDVMEKNGTSSD